MSDETTKPDSGILLFNSKWAEIWAGRRGAIITINSVLKIPGKELMKTEIKLLQTQAVKLAEWILKEVG